MTAPLWALRHFTPRQIARALDAANACGNPPSAWVPIKGTVMGLDGSCRGAEVPDRAAWHRHIAEQSQADTHPILKLPKRA